MTTTTVIAAVMVVVVAIATQSSLASITCYDCSDTGTGCSSCQQLDNCSCSPCWMNASTPVCNDPTTCSRQVLVQPNPIGGNVKLTTATCSVTQQGPTSSNNSPSPVVTTTGCYSSTYTVTNTGPTSYSYSMTQCYCNSDRCNSACSCGVEAPVSTPPTTTTTKTVIQCSNGGQLSRKNSVVVMMLSVAAVIVLQAM